MGEVTGIDRCALCGSDDLSVLLMLGAQPLAERDDGQRYPLTLMQCRRCSFGQLSHEVDRAETFPPAHPYSSGNSAALREHFTALAHRLSAGLVAGDVVVDIGANDGTLLGAFGPGFDRVAVEPTWQAEKIPDGVHVYREFFGTAVAAKILAEHGRPKLITATNVLAHVSDPQKFVGLVHDLLHPDGQFLVECHDLASVSDGLQFDTIYHEHLWYFTPATLCRLLEDGGLTVQSVEPIATHGGSLRVLAHRRVGELSRRARDAAVVLRSLLQTSPYPIYGIGATTRATPLIHFAEITELLDCVCEVSGSDKIGQTIPGTTIPIVDEERLITDQPPTALLLSWHLAAHIVPKLRKQGYRGRIVVPLPTLEVLDA